MPSNRDRLTGRHRKAKVKIEKPVEPTDRASDQPQPLPPAPHDWNEDDHA